MRSHRWPAACCWFIALTLGLDLAVPARAAAPSPMWKVADAFQFSVKVYPRAAGGDKPGTAAKTTEKEPKPIASYDMHAIVLPVLPFEECGCWKLQFVPFSKLSAFKSPYRLWIDKDNGQTRKGSRFAGPKETPLAVADVAPMVLDAPAGYPVEIIPAVDAATLPTARLGTTIEIATHRRDAVLERTAIVRVGGKAEIEIRQRWAAGAKWWSEYERFYHGQRDLSARLLTPKTLPPVPPPVAPTPAAPPPSGDDFRADPRLQVRIDADLHHCPLQDLLDLLSQKANVQLTIDSSLAAETPGLGGTIQRGVPAWKIMEQIAHDFVVDGRWDKTASGYQLFARGAIEPRSPRDGRTFLLWWFASMTGLLLASFAARYFLRWRLQSSPDAGKSDAT
jgi:hypothetical protein